jgi:digeranylgeranylglycerophospholipid reductase
LKEYSFDLVVVGAGPAGSSAAFAASIEGVSVALLEKEKLIAETVRTSGVTWITDAKEFGIPESCYNPISNYSFCSPTKSVTISHNEPKAAVLDVRKTYRHLAEQAQNSGAKLFLNTNVTEIITDYDNKPIGVIAKISESQVKFNAKMVIDCSGFQSVVVKSLGLAEQWSRFGAGAEYEVKAENVQSDTWWLMVGHEYSPAGYAWIFPVSKDTVRIGVGVGKPDSDVDPTERLDKLIEEKKGPIKDLGNITKIEFHYGLIPNDGLSRKTVYDNLILVGDSAGQANPLVLEGIRYAIRFGRVAGKTAADAIKSENTTQKSLEPYEKNWKKAIESKINSASKIQNRWIGLTDEEWEKELEIISELSADEFLDFIRADFSVSSIIRLATHHPKLAVRQLFNIVKGT